MQMQPTLETFYLSILDYAGMRYDEGIIKSNNDQINDITIDGKHLTLPYFDNLKNPNNRHIFHPLNESYNSPETTFLAAYKKRMTLDINIRVYAMIDTLLRVGIDVALQKKVKSPKLLDMLTRIGEVDTTLRESFSSIIKHSQKVNEEGFIVDFHVKKNGHFKDTPYAAIGKVSFVLYKELNKALDGTSDGYRVFGAKVRKKDILSLIGLFNIIFEGLDDTDAYTATTDMKTFRFFNALLLSTYFVTAKVNEVGSLLKELKEPSLEVQEMMSNLGWTEVLEQVYDLTTDIRSIPNQTNARTEGNALKLKEPTHTTAAPTHSHAPIPPSFNPSNVPTSQAPVAQPVHTPQNNYQQPQPQVQQPPQPQQPPSVEDIIRNSVQQQVMYPNHQFNPGYPPQRQMYPQQQQPMYPQQGMYPQQQMQQPMQPQMYPQQMQQPMQQPMYPQQQQPMYPQQGMYPQQMQQGMSPEQALNMMPQPRGGIPINPHLYP